jgi:hypothetical protein
MMRTARRRIVLAGALVLSLVASLFCVFNAQGQSQESDTAPLAERTAIKSDTNPIRAPLCSTKG